MENQQQPVNTDAPALPELSVNDLQNLRAVVETAARRGAFQAQEMSAVGSVFDKLNNFLNALQAKSDADKETDEASQG